MAGNALLCWQVLQDKKSKINQTLKPNAEAHSLQNLWRTDDECECWSQCLQKQQDWYAVIQVMMKKVVVVVVANLNMMNVATVKNQEDAGYV